MRGRNPYTGWVSAISWIRERKLISRVDGWAGVTLGWEGGQMSLMDDEIMLGLTNSGEKISSPSDIIHMEQNRSGNSRSISIPRACTDSDRLLKSLMDRFWLTASLDRVSWATDRRLRRWSLSWRCSQALSTLALQLFRPFALVSLLWCNGSVWVLAAKM